MKAYKTTPTITVGVVLFYLVYQVELGQLLVQSLYGAFGSTAHGGEPVGCVDLGRNLYFFDGHGGLRIPLLL